MLKKFKKISTKDSFPNFQQDEKFKCFKKCNLIYGLNGTGKTTISNLLYKHKDKIEENEFFEITKGEEPLRAAVFNKAYVNKNVFQLEGSLKKNSLTNSLAPIYLGDIAQYQREISELKSQQKEIEKETSAIERHMTQKAREIKELFIKNSNDPSYTNYNIRKFKEKLNTISNLESELISDQKTQEYITLLKTTEIKKLIKYNFDANLDLDKIINLINTELSKTSIIQDLKDNTTFTSWVTEGRELHKEGDQWTRSVCIFCTNTISDDRKRELDAHFSHYVSDLQREISAERNKIKQKIEECLSINIPSKEELYPKSESSYTDLNDFKKQRETYIENIKKLDKILEEKSINPYQNRISVDKASIANSINNIDSALQNLHVIIDQHESIRENFESEQARIRELLERGMVARGMQDYYGKKINELKNLCLPYTEFNELKPVESFGRAIDKIQNKINQLEQRKDIQSFPRSINKGLELYFGDSRLRIDCDIGEKCYYISRKDNPNPINIETLSEGERNSIAFLYFLLSLKENRYESTPQQENGEFIVDKNIVVIDDPVSSFDINKLSTAFSFMVDKICNAGQIFILTHNLPFLNRVRLWMQNEDKFSSKRKYYMLKEKIVNGERTIEIVSMPDGIKQHATEYQLLFSNIYNIRNNYKNRVATNSDDFLWLPNTLRCFIEIYTAFFFPQWQNCL